MEHSKKYRLMANKLIRTLPEFADIKAAKVIQPGREEAQ